MSTTGVEPHAPAPVSAADRRPRAALARRGDVRSRRSLASPRTRTGSTCRRRSCSALIFVVPTAAVVLLQPHPLDAVRRPSSSASTTSSSSSSEPSLTSGLRNTIVYAVVTSGLKVVIGLLLATLLTSRLRTAQRCSGRSIFFPVLVSTVAVGHHVRGADASVDGPRSTGRSTVVGIDGPAWLTDPNIALLSVALVDVWKGVGIALVIFIAGIVSIPEEYFDAARLEGGAWVKFRHVILPLSRNATFTVILLSFIGGLRSFDLIWTMTRGGPGFTTDVIASTIYKQYQAGFYGLATAGNVILFIVVMLLVFPMMRFFNRQRDRAVRAARAGPSVLGRRRRARRRRRRVRRPVHVHRGDRGEGRRPRRRGSSSPGRRTGSSSRTSRPRSSVRGTASWSRRSATACS